MLVAWHAACFSMPWTPSRWISCSVCLFCASRVLCARTCVRVEHRTPTGQYEIPSRSRSHRWQWLRFSVSRVCEACLITSPYALSWREQQEQEPLSRQLHRFCGYHPWCGATQLNTEAAFTHEWYLKHRLNDIVLQPISSHSCTQQTYMGGSLKICLCLYIHIEPSM